MTELASILKRLGLEGYLQAFLEEGFDTWETVLDITESDLTALHVKRGHRRRLQRAIADSRGVAYDRNLGSPGFEGPERGIEGSQSSPANSAPERGGAGGIEPKRKYRRHPKPDENAPERPPSAYVIFSNKIRDEVRGESLSFTDIAKLVGEKWQTLTPMQKEPYESRANVAKETYVAELARYKKTDDYKAYLQYLADFKAKHGEKPAESKRPRLETEDSGGTSNSSKPDTAEPTPAAQRTGHARMGSVNSKHPTPLATNLPVQNGSSALGSAGLGPSSSLTQIPSSSPNADSPIGGYNEGRYHSSQPSLISQGSTLSDWSTRSNLPSMSSVPLHTNNPEPGISSRPWSSLQHQDSAMSSASSQHSFGSAHLMPAHLTKHPSSDEPRLQRSTSMDGPGPKKTEYPMLIHPPLVSHPPAHTPNMQWPPLQSLDSRSRRLPDPNLRALPPPSLSSMDSSGSFRGTSRVTPPVYRHGRARDSPKGSEGSRSPMESSENEAANSLAALAYGTGTGSTRDIKPQ